MTQVQFPQRHPDERAEVADLRLAAPEYCERHPRQRGQALHRGLLKPQPLQRHALQGGEARHLCLRQVQLLQLHPGQRGQIGHGRLADVEFLERHPFQRGQTGDLGPLDLQGLQRHPLHGLQIGHGIRKQIQPLQWQFAQWRNVANPRLSQIRSNELPGHLLEPGLRVRPQFLPQLRGRQRAISVGRGLGSGGLHRRLRRRGLSTPREKQQQPEEQNMKRDAMGHEDLKHGYRTVAAFARTRATGNQRPSARKDFRSLRRLRKSAGHLERQQPVTHLLAKVATLARTRATWNQR